MNMDTEMLYPVLSASECLVFESSGVELYARVDLLICCRFVALLVSVGGHTSWRLRDEVECSRDKYSYITGRS